MVALGVVLVVWFAIRDRWDVATLLTALVAVVAVVEVRWWRRLIRARPANAVTLPGPAEPTDLRSPSPPDPGDHPSPRF